MNLITVRNDLQKGLTIEETCLKYNISFQEMFTMFHGYERNQVSLPTPKCTRVTRSPEHYIYIRDNTYAVRKQIKGKTKIFGTYNSIEDAIKVREALKIDGWHQTHVDQICDKLGVLRRKGHPNQKVRYS